MQLTYVLTAAFGILASARLQRPHGYSYNQQKGVAQVRDYVPNGNTGFNSSTGTGTGTVTNIGSPGSCPTIVAPPSNNGGGSTASFTRYSGCNSPSAACGWYSSTGYNAAISQAAFGGAPGSGPGTACGGCWRLAPGFSGANAIVVKVNNLCPADENNPVCAKPADVDIHFDLCQDSCASAALFGTSGTEFGYGTAERVDCSLWTGGANVS